MLRIFFDYISIPYLIKAESLRTSSTALPGAPLTSFFDSLSPLQKQLLLQQQFQQVSPAIINQNPNSSPFLPNSLENSLLNMQGTEDIWFSVSILSVNVMLFPEPDKNLF